MAIQTCERVFAIRKRASGGLRQSGGGQREKIGGVREKGTTRSSVQGGGDSKTAGAAKKTCNTSGGAAGVPEMQKYGTFCVEMPQD